MTPLSQRDYAIPSLHCKLREEGLCPRQDVAHDYNTRCALHPVIRAERSEEAARALVDDHNARSRPAALFAFGAAAARERGKHDGYFSIFRVTGQPNKGAFLARHASPHTGSLPPLERPPSSSGLFFVDLRAARWRLLLPGAVTLFAFASSASPRAQHGASEGRPFLLVHLPRALTEVRGRFACLPLYGAVALNASKDVVASLSGTFLPRPGSPDLNEGRTLFSFFFFLFFSDNYSCPHSGTKGIERFPELIMDG
ncbi:hypothetical protein MRX96_030666 [Rhipicephalus microplus]